MRIRYVPMARHNVHTCSVHKTAINTKPSPLQVAVPAVKRCPGEISNAFPISPTILSSAFATLVYRSEIASGSEIRLKINNIPKNQITQH